MTQDPASFWPAHQGNSNSFSDQPRAMLPHERHAVLTAMLERELESAWEIAHYERAQRDEYTSKIRFGLAALNAASMVTVLNLPSITAGVEPIVTLLTAFWFLVGTGLAGYSLMAHQTRLIELTGSTSARALALDRAVSLTAHPVGSPEHAALGDAMKEAHGHQVQTYELSMRALRCQWWSASTWMSGAVMFAFLKAQTFLPSRSQIFEWVSGGF